MAKTKTKSWYKRWWAMIFFIFVGLIILGGLFGDDNSILDNSPINNLEDNGIIQAPDTKKILFTLNGSEIVKGGCSTAKQFSEYGVVFPENCVGLSSIDITNYCELGNKKGENVNLYYCRPMRFMKCKIISPSGEIKDVKYYGITKVLNCSDTQEQLIDIQVKSCSSTGFGFDCS